MRSAIVIGAGGFVGRHLVAELEGRGIAVLALARARRPGAPPNAPSDAPSEAAWLTRIGEIIAAAAPDVVFQLAGRASGSAAELEAANLGITERVIAALARGAARPLLVCCGSAAEYGAAISDGVPVAETARCAPLGPYGATKLAQTQAALAFAASGAPVLVARLFNIVGPGMPEHLALGDFARQLARLPRDGVLRVGNLAMRRDFVDVVDAARALVDLAVNPLARGVVNICSGIAIRLGDPAERLIAQSGRHVTIVPEVARMRPGELAAIIGSTARQMQFGIAVPPPDFDRITARIWRHAQALVASS